LPTFIGEHIALGSPVITDGFNAYRELAGDTPGRTIQRRQKDGDQHCLPCAHRVISLFKRWLRGTHQGSVGSEHLDDYLNEFTFRFNRRTSTSRGQRFYRLAQQAVQVEAAP
jgi:transposase-like protein